jgi:hypothetical protein
VYGLFNFDDETPGFQAPTAAGYPSFSMMVATGYNRVAMIQTGAADSTGVFQQTTTYYTTPQVAPAAQNVFIFGGISQPNSLPDLGAITAAEVARVAPDVDPAASAGWLFVGGERGVAVLRYTALGGYQGTGWANDVGQGLAGLVGVNPDDYPGGSNYAWVALTPPAVPAPANPVSFTNIRKMVSDGTYLYVLTRNTLYRILMNAPDFVAGQLSAANFAVPLDIRTADRPVKKARSNPIAFTLFHDQDEFFDMMLVQKAGGVTVLVIATSKGLVEATITDLTGVANPIKTVLVNSTNAVDPATPSLGPVLRLDFVSALRGGQLDDNGLAQGNLYALGIDANGLGLNTYRFDANGATVNYFIEPYGGPATPSDYFYQIGSIANLAPHEFSGLLDFVTYTRHVGDLPTYFVDNMPVLPPTASFLQTAPINLGADLTHGLHLGIKTMDTASGAVYVPGEFGVRVNE